MTKRRKGSVNESQMMILAYSFSQAVAAMYLMAQTQGLYDDLPTAAYCIGGSVAGAFVSLSIFPDVAVSESRHVNRNLLIKLCASVACGLIGAPLVVEWWKITSKNYIIGIGGGLSFVGVTALHVIAPEIPKVVKLFWRSKVKDYTGLDLKTERPDPPKADNNGPGDI